MEKSMSNVPKHAVITAFISKTKDRFHEYNEPKTVDERFQIVADLEGFSGVEIIYPYEVQNIEDTKKALKKYWWLIVVIVVGTLFLLVLPRGL
jgi:hypothetical protein